MECKGVYLIRYNKGSSGWYTACWGDYYFSGYSMTDLLAGVIKILPPGSTIRWHKI